MAGDRRHVHAADLPGFSQTPLTRRTVIAGAGAAIAAVGDRALFRPLGTAVATSTAGKQTEARFGFMFKDLPGYLTGQNVPILQRRPGRFTHLRRELL